MTKAVCYVAMLIFDFAVIAGTAYLVLIKGCSAWWMLPAFVLLLGSNPSFVFDFELSTDEEKK